MSLLPLVLKSLNQGQRPVQQQWGLLLRLTYDVDNGPVDGTATVRASLHLSLCITDSEMLETYWHYRENGSGY